MTAYDDLGTPVPLTGPARRIVSLVPSLTEAIAATARDRLVGATDWCSRPHDLEATGVTRVRGTKNPDRAVIGSLRPDLVLANQEENRELDVRRLREAGIPVWVTRMESVPEAVASMRRVLAEALRVDEPPWLTEAARLWSTAVPAPRARVAVAVWRDPWMVVGRDTFTGDLLARLGLANVFAGHRDRYPTLDPAELDGAGADVVLLPDEPYVFTADDGPEVFTRTRTRLVSGRLLTWYGPALVEAHAALTAIS